MGGIHKGVSLEAFGFRRRPLVLSTAAAVALGGGMEEALERGRSVGLLVLGIPLLKTVRGEG